MGCASDLVLILQGVNREEIENLAYTLKEINTVAGLYTGICSPEEFHDVKEIWCTLFRNMYLPTYVLILQESLFLWKV